MRLRSRATERFVARVVECGVAGLLLLAPLGAQESSSVREGSHEDDLRAIRLELDALRASLEELDAEAEDLSSRLERSTLELRIQQSRLAEAETAYEVAREAVSRSELRVAELEEALAGLREKLERRLVALYQMGGQGYVRLLLAVDPDSEPLQVVRQLRYLLRRDLATLESYLAVRDDLEGERAKREESRREAEGWLVTQQERRDGLRRVRDEQQRLLALVQAERTDVRGRTSDLEDKEARLGRLIAMLAAEESGVAASGAPIQEFRGVLDWPVRGEVTTRFGPLLDPRYGTKVPHNGIAIETREGDDVRVVYPGRVLFAAPFEGFGFTAVVQHPDHVFTLYAGLAELGVVKDDVLSLGDRVGAASSSLYFELRVESVPEDPLRWLR